MHACKYPSFLPSSTQLHNKIAQKKTFEHDNYYVWSSFMEDVATFWFCRVWRVQFYLFNRTSANRLHMHFVTFCSCFAYFFSPLSSGALSFNRKHDCVVQCNLATIVSEWQKYRMCLRMRHATCGDSPTKHIQNIWMKNEEKQEAQVYLCIGVSVCVCVCEFTEYVSTNEHQYTLHTEKSVRKSEKKQKNICVQCETCIYINQLKLIDNTEILHIFNGRRNATQRKLKQKRTNTKRHLSSASYVFWFVLRNPWPHHQNV